MTCGTPLSPAARLDNAGLNNARLNNVRDQLGTAPDRRGERGVGPPPRIIRAQRPDEPVPQLPVPGGLLGEGRRFPVMLTGLLRADVHSADVHSDVAPGEVGQQRRHR